MTTLAEYREAQDIIAAYAARVRSWQDVPRRRLKRPAIILEHRTGSGVTRHGVAIEPRDHTLRGNNP